MIQLKWFIYAFVFATTAAAQQKSESLEQRLDKLLTDEFYQQATIGVAIYDLTADKMLYVHNEKRLCRPASNMKLLTTATALTVLKSDYNFKTGLFYTGEINEGRLTGDVYLVGGFDPELTTEDLDNLILKLKTSGINHIEGNLYLDASMSDSIFWGKAWSWDDDLEAFQPYMSPIPLNKGAVKLIITPALPDSAPIIKTVPESSFIEVVNRVTTVKKNAETPQNSLKFSREYINQQSKNLVVVSGVIAANAKPYEKMISLKNPYSYALTLFAEKIQEHFPESVIEKTGFTKLPADAKNLGYVTHSLEDVIRKANKESDNLNAEMMLYALGYKQNSAEPATIEKGIAVVQKFISQLGFEPKNYRIVDGSGLSNQNYLSPELLVGLLKYMHKSSDFEIFRKSLPVAGQDGTLANRLKSAVTMKKISAKTGSLTGITTLSGYAASRNGNLLAFSIMIQNFTEKSAFVAVNYIDKICEAMTE